jgi:acetyltransferase-like isoleucine patch superfamily enzyme
MLLADSTGSLKLRSKMTVISINDAKKWLKTSKHPFAQNGFRVLKGIQLFELPVPRVLFKPVYYLHNFVTGLLAASARILYWTPLFKSRVIRAGKNLYLYGGMPYLSGPLQISYGNNCRISGQTTFSARMVSQPAPELILGDNIDIGWMSTIAVGSKVTIGNNVRIAGQAFLAGYPGHPLDAADRAAGLSDIDGQVGDITIEDDVWIATGVTILPNVRIGKRSIIATGSIVTKDVPADVIAGGIPAKVIRSFSSGEN